LESTSTLVDGKSRLLSPWQENRHFLNTWLDIPDCDFMAAGYEETEFDKVPLRPFTPARLDKA